MFSISISDINLAYGKQTWQSSTYWEHHGDASRAVDGNLAPDYWRHLSCTQTKHEVDPWWIVDLEQVYVIARVAVSNRGDRYGMPSSTFH